MDRRNPHIPLDRSLIQHFLKGRDIRSTELIKAGKSNTNYKLLLSDDQICVLRLYAHGDAGREVFVMSMVSDMIPVPRELDRGEGWSIFEFLHGDHLAIKPQNTDVAAEALARISSITFEKPGLVNPDGTISPFDFEEEDFVHQQLKRDEVTRWVGQEVIEKVLIILGRESQRLEELGAESRLIHGDFNPTNILVHNGSVSGILDWEFSMSGTPYMDIGNLFRHSKPGYRGLIEKGLLDGGMDLQSDWRERAELVDLGSHLEFLTSARSDEFKIECVSRIHRFINLFDS
jgi:aminoglycoside phosphotransferase (APT) family kinase protein